MLRKTILVIAFVVLGWVTLKASRFTSCQNGYWNDTTTWSGGKIPNYDDSIVIKHYLIYSQNIVIPPSGFFKIDSSGTLCGLFNFKTMCGSYFYNYGILLGLFMHYMIMK
jgi:hypothetical protein